MRPDEFRDGDRSIVIGRRREFASAKHSPGPAEAGAFGEGLGGLGHGATSQPAEAVYLAYVTETAHDLASVRVVTKSSVALDCVEPASA